MTINQQQIDFDAEHIWHPYTNLSQPTPTFSVESAEGVYLHLTNGQKVIDGMSSWWSTIHGYNHPKLNEAIIQQVSKMSHVMFGGLTHEPAISLCQKLVDITHPNLDKVFLADSGSISVEVALKMALQYWYSNTKLSEQKRKQKTKFLTIKNGYHGDTFAAMSVCDPVNGMHSMFEGVLQKHLFVEAPSCRNDADWQASDIEEFKNCIDENVDQIAAVILEPIVQGAGGMRIYCPEFLRQVRKLCDQHGVLLIFDEIATGFGRTGKLFAYEHAGVCPDILCVGKALTGGTMSLAATLCTETISSTISSFEGGNLMHGPTFMGNPLACAVANASLELLQNSNWQSQVNSIESQLENELAECAQLESVADVRVIGAIGVIELKQAVDMHVIQPRLVELGVWIRPFGKLLYIMPPYIINPAELTKLTDAMKTITLEAC
ncbi:MAG: adenosylmethionine--8-amino-7-oxononanoate transaminase [Kangiellaceae bacterium]|nr:adenosylmethionine--8-amino-7-oxononanoate transaminase [Kangiellaceae bacterium]